MAKKKCTKCRKEKPLTAFHIDRRTRDGRSCKCKKCKLMHKRAVYHKPGGRNAHLKRTYGISEEQYEKLVAEQASKCAVCGRKADVCGRLVVDHDHITGAIRALLCDRCNRAAGAAGDDPKLLQKLAQYLETHSKDSN